MLADTCYVGKVYLLTAWNLNCFKIQVEVQGESERTIHSNYTHNI